MHDVIAKSILSLKGGMNIYRGCAHGCIYCDSRSVCYGMKHDFEDIEIKRNAPELLDDALARRREKCVIFTGSMSDPYQPLEKTERLTRCCLEIIRRRGFGVSPLTKSDLVLRDLDLIAEINARAACVLQMTLTTYDEALCSILEPRVCGTYRRYETLCAFRDAGVPSVVWLTPILPFINDTEENLRGLLSYCFDAGVKGLVVFGAGVTLREGDREYFYEKLDAHFPGVKKKYCDAFGLSYECQSDNALRLMRIIEEECERRGVLWKTDEVFHYMRSFSDKTGGTQLGFFG